MTSDGTFPGICSMGKDGDRVYGMKMIDCAVRRKMRISTCENSKVWFCNGQMYSLHATCFMGGGSNKS